MAKQTINIGATANDGSGDPLRTAFDKINDNFTEVYTVSGAGAGNNLAFSGNSVISEDSSGDIILDPNGTGRVIVATATELRFTDHVDNAIGYVDADGDMQFKSTLTFNGTDLIAPSAKVSDLTSGRVVHVSTSGALIDSSNFTFVGGLLTVADLILDDISIIDNNITSNTSNTNIVLLPNGTGVVEVRSNLTTSGTITIEGLASLDGGIDVDGVFTVENATGNIDTTGTLIAGFHANRDTVSTSLTLDTGSGVNSVVYGPITIANGVTFTIANNSKLKILEF
jgi:hypothetical protein